VREDARVKWLNDLAARGPYWFITDEGDPRAWMKIVKPESKKDGE